VFFFFSPFLFVFYLTTYDDHTSKVIRLEI